MMKYLFCILSLAFLLVGVAHVSNGNLQEHREKSGVPVFSNSTASFSSADATNAFLNDSASDDDFTSSTMSFSESSEYYTPGILSALSGPSASVPVKTLKFNSIPIIVQLLSLQDSRWPESKGKTLFADTDYLKYSNKYYIYALGHILI